MPANKMIKLIFLITVITYQFVSNANILSEWHSKVQKYDLLSIQPLEKIYDHLSLLASCPYGHVRLRELVVRQVRARFKAETFMGNRIPYVNISVGPYGSKPAVAVVGGMAGCDWNTVTTSMYLIQNLAIDFFANYELMEKMSWFIVPVLNPDGYSETVTNPNRKNWCKNMYRSNITIMEDDCFGVYLPKNFEYQWINYNYENASFCEPEYADRPFTQVESAALRDTLKDHLNIIKVYVTLAQQGRKFWYPYTFSPVKPKFHEVFENMLKRAAAAATKKTNKKFRYGHVSEFQNSSAGGSDDWIKAHLGVPLAFTFSIASAKNNSQKFNSTAVGLTSQAILVALKTLASLSSNFFEGSYVFSSGNIININMTIIFWAFLLFVLCED